jgi:hypothetical protein
MPVCNLANRANPVAVLSIVCSETSFSGGSTALRDRDSHDVIASRAAYFLGGCVSISCISTEGLLAAGHEYVVQELWSRSLKTIARDEAHFPSNTHETLPV